MYSAKSRESETDAGRNTAYDPPPISLLMSGAFLTVWKSALISPLPKMKAPSVPDDYRRIFILYALSKSLEKIVFDHMMNYLEKHDLQHPCQSAYHASHNTQTALLRLLDDIQLASDSRGVTILMLFDFFKALERVRHGRLTDQLRLLNYSRPVSRR